MPRKTFIFMPSAMSQDFTHPPIVGPWVDINLSQLHSNYQMAASLAAGAEVAAVVKCNAYGLGAKDIAPYLATHSDCRSFFVIYPEEGKALREFLRDITPAPKIYVLDGPLAGSMEIFKNNDLIPVLNSLEQAAQWATAFPGAPCVLHVDTGMNRYGAEISELHAISKIDNLNIDIVMSHLACSSQPSNDLNRKQRDHFLTVCSKFPKARKSLAASAGTLMGAEYHYDMTRVGIALYGGSPFDEDDMRINAVASLRAPVIQIHDVRADETVGYDATYKLERASRLATIAIGYGDGFLRAASNRGKVIINGAYAPIVGRISMDLMTVDVTDITDRVQIGDIAELFGENRRIHDAAATCETTSYELLTNIGTRVDRRYRK